jgi:ATP-dependent RNA/DNA helicase IGHMBP2
LAVRDLVLDDSEPSPGGRLTLWLRPHTAARFEDVRISPGEPVRLWLRDPQGDTVEAAVVSRIEAARIAVVVSTDYAEFLDHAVFQLDREAPEVSFERGARALASLLAAKPGSRAERYRAIFYAGAEPTAPAPAPPLQFFDQGLNEPQRAAISFGLAAPEVALIHGPPGTGKTRCLVELVRQAVRRGERVYVSAASNAAVDNLAERLAACDVAVLRLGHPARVSPAALALTLEARLDASPNQRLARRHQADARDARRRLQRRRARGHVPPAEARALQDEARAAQREAYAQLELARELIFAEAKVVCATAVGVDPALLAQQRFDRVVLDEATQAVDPAALCALLQAERAVLAGDPCQLPPTVIDRAAADGGLQRTLFERLSQERGEHFTRLLSVQYRMHPALMQFPSDRSYGGRLVAAPGLAEHTLENLGARPDPLRPGPLVFLDTAGKGFLEERSEADPSTKNPGQGERVAIEVERLLARGVAPEAIGLITPYDAQVRWLRARLALQCQRGLEIASVDAFQGREKEAIVVDLVRCNDEGELGFLRDVRRMNVALTRAKRFLLVVGDSATLACDDYYRAFMDAAEAQGAALSAWSDDGIWSEPQPSVTRSVE